MTATTTPRDSLWGWCWATGGLRCSPLPPVWVFAGGFAMFVAGAGLLLPQDVAYLGMDAAELAAVAGPRVVRFMIHDRVA